MMTNSKKSAPMLAGQVIQEKIRSGEFPLDSALPGQRELAKILGIGRPAIREAISALEGLGLLRVEPGRGVFVASPGAASTRRWRFEARYSLDHVYAVREALETLSVRLATDRATAPDLKELKNLAKRLKKAVDNDDLIEMSLADSEFHRKLALVSGNGLLLEMLDWFKTILTESRNIAFANPDPARRSEPSIEHTKIIEAMEKRDRIAAARLMKTHITNARSRI